MTRREKVMLWCLIGILVLSAGGLSYAYRDNIKEIFKKPTVIEVGNVDDETNVGTDTTGTDVGSSEGAPLDTEGPKGYIGSENTDLGVTWVAPTKIADPKVFKDKIENADFDVAAVEYYRIANLASGGELIMAKADCGMAATCIYRFKKTKAGNYWYLSKYSNETDYEAIQRLIRYDDTNKVEVDSSTVYAGLSSPDIIFDNNEVQFNRGWNEGLFSMLENPVKLTETKYGVIYKIIGESTDDLALFNTYLKRADGTYILYNMAIPFYGDDGVPLITWSETGKNTKTYSNSVVRGKCGGSSGLTVVRTAISADRLTTAGTTSSGVKVYYPKSADDGIYKTAYASYEVGRKDTEIKIGTPEYLTYADFVAKKPIFVWKDSFGNNLVFIDNDLGGLAECGKPVIYLYPESEMNVSVKVGANVRISEPAYNTGWSVLAKKGGQLILNEKSYPYLYWEGKGKGVYPEVSGGFVIAKADLEKTLENQLGQLGLNQKETADFMEFWLPKMPTSPYTRLSWLGAAEMDRLAPLSVSPQPDTNIRVFLDFEGLNKPTPIEPQKLMAKERKGFTLVEWGGLLK